MQKSLRNMKQGMDTQEMQRLAEQADPAAVGMVKKTIEQYRNKSEGELMNDLRSAIMQQI